MKITIDNIEVEVQEQETLWQIANRLGKRIPSMCYAEGKEHMASCMVCMVKNAANGQMIPSCSTHPVEGMQIVTDTEDVMGLRRIALELLLSDHRADCEAPCTTVCPKGLNVERVLWYYDTNRYSEAKRYIAAAFNLPTLGCDDCPKTPCEKVCRRGMVDKHVEIREIIRLMSQAPDPDPNTNPLPKGKAKMFTSKLGHFSPKEKEWLKVSTDVPSNCLHCACSAQDTCKLRKLADECGIKSPRYGVSSDLPFKVKKHVVGRLWFEPAKCIRCGLCVYNTKDGFTFKGRGFGMQVVIPDESRAHVSEDIAKLCPTGALYLED